MGLAFVRGHGRRREVCLPYDSDIYLYVERAVPLAECHADVRPVEIAALTEEERLELEELLDDDVGATEATTIDLTTVLMIRVVEYASVELGAQLASEVYALP